MKSIRLLVAAFVIAALVGAAGLAIQPAVADDGLADLEIEQPNYVPTDVVVSDEDGERIYEVGGDELLIRFTNADHANVTAVDVRDGPGTIEYDENIDLFRFDAEGQAGSSELLFQVEHADGSVSEHRAILQVRDVHWTHRTAEEDQELREAANNWSQVESEAAQIDPDEDPADVVSRGLTFARFIDSPFSTFLADIQAILIMMVFRPGGWAILGVLIGMALIGVASGARYRNRTQKQLADWGDIQHEKDEAYLQKARRILQQNDWNQLFPDEIARAMREYFGRNVWQGFKQYMLLRSPVSVKGTVLQMMAQLGYEGYRVETDDGEIEAIVTTDGEPDGENVTAIDLSALDYENEDHREFIEAVDPEDLDEKVYKASDEQIDLSSASFPISNREVDDADLLKEINPAFPEDYENEEEMARHLGQMMQFVIEHPHTDENGQSRRDMDLLSFMSEMDTVLADQAEFPAGHFQRRELLWLADHIAPEDELKETVENLSQDSIGGDEDIMSGGRS